MAFLHVLMEFDSLSREELDDLEFGRPAKFVMSYCRRNGLNVTVYRAVVRDLYRELRQALGFPAESR